MRTGVRPSCGPGISFLNCALHKPVKWRFPRSVSDPMPGRYFLKTFGCQMNEYDSSRMGDVLAAAEGMQPAADEQSGDILLMNTCSVRDKAEDKVYSLLGTWRLLKAQRPEIIIGV